MGSFSSTRESPLSSSPTRLATMLRIVSGRSLQINKKQNQRNAFKDSQRVEPQVASNRISNLEEKDPRRVDDPKTFDSSNVLLEDKSCIGAWVEESFAVSTRRGN